MADTCSFRLHVGDGKGLSYTSTTPGGQLMLLTHPQWELLRLIIWMKLSEREFHRNMKGTLSGGGHTASPTKQKGDMEWGATARPLLNMKGTLRGVGGHSVSPTISRG